METLKNSVLDALQSAGYDLISSMEYWGKFKEELKTLPPGKYNYIVGNTEISFTKKQGINK